MLNSVNNKPIYFKMEKTKDIEKLVQKNGSNIPYIFLNLRRGETDPLTIYTYPKSISLDDEIFIQFKNEEAETFFIRELNFLLESINELPVEYRNVSHDVEITYEQAIGKEK